MELVQSKIVSLRKIINEADLKTSNNKKEAIELLDAIESEINETESNVEFLESEIKTKDEKIEELEDEVSEPTFTDKIYAGVGKIKYETDNLWLSDIMESVERMIDKRGAKQVMEILSVL